MQTHLVFLFVSQYGYQLPDLLEDNVVYCHVYFKLLGEKLFSYPQLSTQDLGKSRVHVQALEPGVFRLQLSVTPCCGRRQKPDPAEL